MTSTVSPPPTARRSRVSRSSATRAGQVERALTTQQSVLTVSSNRVPTTVSDLASSSSTPKIISGPAYCVARPESCLPGRRARHRRAGRPPDDPRQKRFRHPSVPSRWLENGIVSMATRVPCAYACSARSAQRRGESEWIRRGRPGFGADLDLHRRQHVGRLEQQVTHVVRVSGFAAWNPPPLDQFDLDVSEPARRRSDVRNASNPMLSRIGEQDRRRSARARRSRRRRRRRRVRRSGNGTGRRVRASARCHPRWSTPWRRVGVVLSRSFVPFASVRVVWRSAACRAQTRTLAEWNRSTCSAGSRVRCRRGWGRASGW